MTLHPVTLRPSRWLAYFAGTLLLASCVRVRAWERQRLAAWEMADPFAKTELGAQYRSKVVESKTGGGLPGTAPGGGCGCTQ